MLWPVCPDKEKMDATDYPLAVTGIQERQHDFQQDFGVDVDF